MAGSVGFAVGRVMVGSSAGRRTMDWSAKGATPTWGDSDKALPGPDRGSGADAKGWESGTSLAMDWLSASLSRSPGMSGRSSSGAVASLAGPWTQAVLAGSILVGREPLGAAELVGFSASGLEQVGAGSRAPGLEGKGTAEDAACGRRASSAILFFFPPRFPLLEKRRLLRGPPATGQGSVVRAEVCLGCGGAAPAVRRQGLGQPASTATPSARSRWSNERQPTESMAMPSARSSGVLAVRRRLRPRQWPQLRPSPC